MINSGEPWVQVRYWLAGVSTGHCRCLRRVVVHGEALRTFHETVGRHPKQNAILRHGCSEDFRTAFRASRIILRQVSPESESIFDLIMELGTLCGGDWESLRIRANVDELSLTCSLGYAAVFVENLGNYKVGSLVLTSRGLVQRRPLIYRATTTRSSSQGSTPMFLANSVPLPRGRASCLPKCERQCTTTNHALSAIRLMVL